MRTRLTDIIITTYADSPKIYEPVLSSSLTREYDFLLYNKQTEKNVKYSGTAGDAERQQTVHCSQLF